MLKITAEEIHFIIYQYLLESGKCFFPIATDSNLTVLDAQKA